jgi:hypothetical protein
MKTNLLLLDIIAVVGGELQVLTHQQSGLYIVRSVQRGKLHRVGFGPTLQAALSSLVS